MTDPTPGDAPAAPARRGFVRAPRDFTAGASLVALALFALWASRALDAGSLRAMGPGMLPRAVAVLVGATGLGILVLSLLRAGEGLGRWSWRGPLFVTLGVVGFALTIRTVGLVVAGPLVVLVSGAASSEARPRELVVFAIAITTFCVLLFRYALHLPIPILILPGIVTL